MTMHALTFYWFLSNKGYHSNDCRIPLFLDMPDYLETALILERMKGNLDAMRCNTERWCIGTGSRAAKRLP